jgi:hypothetical protein
MLCFMMEQLQPEVMHHCGGAWPALLVQGARIVLTPAIDELGIAVWTAADGPTCPIGYLRHALGRLQRLGPL